MLLKSEVTRGDTDRDSDNDSDKDSDTDTDKDKDSDSDRDKESDSDRDRDRNSNSDSLLKLEEVLEQGLDGEDGRQELQASFPLLPTLATPHPLLQCIP